MPVIWYNVTTSTNWNRPPVGIVRVELELLNGLKKIFKDRIQECVWHDGNFITKEAYQKLTGQDKVYPQYYELGQKISFGADATALNERHKETGWSGQEQAYTWTEGEEASLVFQLRKKAKTDLKIALEASPFLGKGLEAQLVSIFVNNVQLGEWRVSKHGIYEIGIPTALLDSEFVSIRFSISTPCSPKECGLGDDERKLGIAVYNITLDKTRKTDKMQKCLSRWKNSYEKRKHKLPRLVQRLIRSCNKRIKKIVSFLKNNSDVDTSGLDICKNDICNINRGDIFISVGLDWDYDFYPKMFEMHKTGVNIVTMCHDIIPILYPHFCLSYVVQKFSSYFINQSEYSDIILCNSKCTMKDLKNFIHETGSRDTRLETVRFGDSVVNYALCENEYINELCKTKFILFVSTIERRKNHATLYKAYHLLCARKNILELPKLIFVGMKGWGVDDLMSDIELDHLVEDKIVLLNNISDGELHALYQNALFCVYPSYYEGWGLPVAEALALGKVVLASNAGPIPEVGGELVEYASPWNPEEWASKMERLIRNDDYRNSLETRVRQNYQKRTWDETAQQVASIISNL